MSIFGASIFGRLLYIDPIKTHWKPIADSKLRSSCQLNGKWDTEPICPKSTIKNKVTAILTTTAVLLCCTLSISVLYLRMMTSLTSVNSNINYLMNPWWSLKGTTVIYLCHCTFFQQIPSIYDLTVAIADLFPYTFLVNKSLTQPFSLLWSLNWFVQGGGQFTEYLFILYPYQPKTIV